MYEEEFASRLSSLRIKKGVSAREMSLSIGQNPGYINNIETGKALPSMAVFFFICEYLNITPAEFFDTSNKVPAELASITANLRELNEKQLLHIEAIVLDLATKNAPG